MAITTNAICNSFKKELLQGSHDFDASTDTSSVAITSFANLSFTGVTLTARGALIYNTTTNGGSGTTDAVCVLDFGGNKTATSGTFTIQFPAFTTSAAILRLT